MAHKPVIVLTYPIHREVIRKELAPHAIVRIARDRADLERKIVDADGLITRFFDRVDERLIAKAPRLRAVGNFAVGTDNIDLRACAARGIRVTNTPDVLTRATAELALALLLAAARRIPEGEAMCRTGEFERVGGWQPDMLLGLELKGRTAVLAGKGRIGQETGRLFKALGLKVLWITRLDDEASVARKLRQAQVLSLHFSLNPSTRHWLNTRRLALLPPDAIVINTTRGPVIDEKALIAALRNGRIFAAGLDVYEREPLIPPGLRKLRNAVLLPHLGSATGAAREQMARLAVAGVLGILGGKAPRNEVKFVSIRR